jgi:homoserine kinase
VTAEWGDTAEVTIAERGHDALPDDPHKHTSGIAALAVLAAARDAGVRTPPRGITLTVRKGLPLSGGQGGSAASAVAGAAATNALLGSPFEPRDLLEFCLQAEIAVAGRHLDNIAPSMLGGICLVRSLDPIDVVTLPVPPRLRVVLIHPEHQVSTAEARAVLPATVPRAVTVSQMANVSAMVAALYGDDLALLGRALHDEIAEPARRSLIPGFDQAKAAAIAAGALGASISGSGPTIFALCDSDVGAQRVSHAVRAALDAIPVKASVRVTRIDTFGTRVEVEPPGAR